MKRALLGVICFAAAIVGFGSGCGSSSGPTGSTPSAQAPGDGLVPAGQNWNADDSSLSSIVALNGGDQTTTALNVVKIVGGLGLKFGSQQSLSGPLDQHLSIHCEKICEIKNLTRGNL